MVFFFSSRRRHTRFSRDWSSDVCSSDLRPGASGQDTLRTMSDYGPETYGDRWAAIYDDWVGRLPMDAEATADFLGSIAGGGPALELAIGTGKIGRASCKGKRVEGGGSSG